MLVYLVLSFIFVCCLIWLVMAYLESKEIERYIANDIERRLREIENKLK